MRIAFVNSFFPPDTAITGRSMAEAAAHLRRHHPDAEIRVYASAAAYRSGTREQGPAGVEVVRLGSARRRNGALPRLAQSLLLGREMARRAVAWADVVVSLTDPPLVGVFIGRRKARAERPVRWIEWTMDLYPEAFAAAGLVKRNNPLYRLVAALQRRHPPDAYICLGEAQAEALRDLRAIDRTSAILPCGIADAPPSDRPPAWRQGERRTVIAYAGNLGEAHCPHLLPALVQAADPERFLFLIAIHGAHARTVRERIGAAGNVLWRDGIDHAELAHADIHVASLMPEWTHICVPSKAVSTICLGRPLLFAGDAQSDTARMLGEASWVLPVPRDGRYDRSALTAVLEEAADPVRRGLKERRAREIAKNLAHRKSAALSEVTDLIMGTRETSGGADKATIAA
jgi:hypothetical protein